MITDCHVHIVPIRLHKPGLVTLLKKDSPASVQWEKFCSSPTAFLNYLDSVQVERAVLVSSVAPGAGIAQEDMNHFVGEYAKENPLRLIASGGVLPRPGMDMQGVVEQLNRAK
jgi:hypothetical protein